MNDKPQTLSLPAGGYLAYHKTEGQLPGVIFFGGFMSDMSGSKALALEEYCKTNNRAFIRFDYEGHGQSSGRFEKGTIGKWLGNALKILDELTDGKQIIVGSSMGGWIMLLAATMRTEKVAGLIGIAAAPDFTHELILRDLTAEQRKTMVETGYIEIPTSVEQVGVEEQSDDPAKRGGLERKENSEAVFSGNAAGGSPPKNYIITKELIEQSAVHLLMSYDEITIEAPVRLIHGMKDKDVPWSTALRICDKLISRDVRVILDKEGDHRMSEPNNLRLIEKTLGEMIELCEKQ